MTYTIHRYPAEMIDVVLTPRGEPVTVRPVLPQDADLMQAFVRGLSDGSRRSRFFRALRELPSELLERFTSLDYDRHMALIAEVLVDGEEVVIGDARYVRDGPASAEFAVAVADAWRRQGIGRLLLSRLARRAAAEGVTRLFGDALAANKAMLSLARQAGLAILPHPNEAGLVRLERRLEPVRPGTRAHEPAPNGLVLAA
jgi:acetyltransferase